MTAAAYRHEEIAIAGDTPIIAYSAEGQIAVARTAMLAGARIVEIPPHLGLLDITTRRNAFGRQVRSFEADIQDDIEFALIQMKAETLNRIDRALRRINEATYGCCFECGSEIE